MYLSESVPISPRIRRMFTEIESDIRAGPSVVSDIVTGIQLIIGIAGRECAVYSRVVGRGIVCTANSVIDMLAHSVSIRISWVACFELVT